MSAIESNAVVKLYRSFKGKLKINKKRFPAANHRQGFAQSLKTTSTTVSYQRFLYQHLEHSDSFRILTLEPGTAPEDIRCSLKHAQFKIAPDFEAISYVWGDSSERQTIFVEGKPFEVTTNLFTALHQFRHSKQQRLLWADALCIDQANIPERNQQVAIMANIYSSAVQTLIWLGEKTEYLAQFSSLPAPVDLDLLAFQVLGVIARSETSLEGTMNIAKSRQTLENFIMHHVSTNTSLLDIRNALMHLASHEWFNRVWVLQELVVSRVAILCCGNLSTPWTDDLNYAFRLLFFVSEDDGDPSHKSHARHLSSMAETRTIYQECHNLFLGDLLTDTLDFSASDPRDKVFALINLNTGTWLPSADYNLEPQEAFIQSVVSLFKSSEPDCLKFHIMSIASDTSNGEIWKNLPSWVPDFSAFGCTPNLSSFSKLDGVYSASGEEKAISRFALGRAPILFLHGAKVDRIGALRPAPPPETDKEGWHEETHQFVQSTGQYPSGESAEEVWWRLAIVDMGLDSNHFPTRAAKVFGPYYLDKGINSNHRPEPCSDDFEEFRAHYQSYRVLPKRQWLLCRTEKGYLGWVNPGAKTGDEVCIFSGALAPFLLRRRSDGFYEVVNEAYIHGIMHGEALEWPNFEWEEIALK